MRAEDSLMPGGAQPCKPLMRQFPHHNGHFTDLDA